VPAAVLPWFTLGTTGYRQYIHGRKRLCICLHPSGIVGQPANGGQPKFVSWRNPNYL
jgi:hypothetical protein